VINLLKINIYDVYLINYMIICSFVKNKKGMERALEIKTDQAKLKRPLPKGAEHMVTMEHFPLPTRER